MTASPACRLRLAFVAGCLFETLRQFLVAIGNVEHRPPGFGVAEGLGSGQDFFGACARLTGQRKKPRIRYAPLSQYRLTVLIDNRAGIAKGLKVEPWQTAEG